MYYGSNMIHITQEKRLRYITKYTRASLLRPLSGKENTPSQRIFSCGNDADFIASLNISKSLSINRILSYFEQQRKIIDYRVPNRTSSRNRGRKQIFTLN